MSQKFRLPDGTLASYGDFRDGEPFDSEGNPLYPMVDVVVPGDRYPMVEAREALVLVAGSLTALAIAAVAVTRRRPD